MEIRNIYIRKCVRTGLKIVQYFHPINLMESISTKKLCNIFIVMTLNGLRYNKQKKTQHGDFEVPSLLYLLNQDHNVMIIKSKLVGIHVCE